MLANILFHETLYLNTKREINIENNKNVKRKCKRPEENSSNM